MGRIGRLVIITLVTAYTRVWCIIVITVVTGDALICDDGVCPFKYIIFVMDFK